MLLREYLRTRRSLPLGEAVGLIGPLCSELAQRFAAGERCYVHPSCISLEGSALTLTAPNQAPQAPEDVACHPPELSQTAGPMDARGAVYAVGAILYELVTGLSFGRGLGVQPPRALVPSLPEAFDTLLAVALRANPAERPAELQALASALSGIANTGSMHPADGIDVAFSMAPPTLDVTFSSDIPETITSCPRRLRLRRQRPAFPSKGWSISALHETGSPPRPKFWRYRLR